MCENKDMAVRCLSEPGRLTPFMRGIVCAEIALDSSTKQKLKSQLILSKYLN